MIPVPADRQLYMETERLALEPVVKEHAKEMVHVLSKPDLYLYIPQNPPVLSDLETQYRKWESRSSPKGDELWLNWVARRRGDQKLVGHFQGGFQENGETSVAYTIGKDFQQNGYAFEGLSAVIHWLKSHLKAVKIKAWVDTRNLASVRLLQKLGFNQVEYLTGADFFKGASSDEYVFELNLGAE